MRKKKQRRCEWISDGKDQAGDRFGKKGERCLNLVDNLDLSVGYCPFHREVAAERQRVLDNEAYFASLPHHNCDKHKISWIENPLFPDITKECPGCLLNKLEAERVEALSVAGEQAKDILRLRRDVEHGLKAFEALTRGLADAQKRERKATARLIAARTRIAAYERYIARAVVRVGKPPSRRAIFIS